MGGTADDAVTLAVDDAAGASGRRTAGSFARARTNAGFLAGARAACEPPPAACFECTSACEAAGTRPRTASVELACARASGGSCGWVFG